MPKKLRDVGEIRKKSKGYGRLNTCSSPLSRTKSVELKRRNFFYVPATGEGAIARNRSDRHFKAIRGIRQLHCVKSLPQQEKLLVRYRSCYCISCITDDEDQCLNKEWMDDWKKIDIPRQDLQQQQDKQQTTQLILTLLCILLI